MTWTKSTSFTGLAGEMRTFRVGENIQGLITWNICEVFEGNRLKQVADVHSWIADGCDINANRLGVVVIEAGNIEIVNGAARFTE